MLSWNLQKELIRTLWVEPKVREVLSPVLKDIQFDRPDLQWVTRVLCKEDGNPVPLTSNELLEKCSSAHPDIYDACKSLVPELEKAQTQDVYRAVESGRVFAAHQKSLVFSGMLPTLIKTGQWGEIRNMTEELLSLSGQLAQDDEGLVVQRASDVPAEKVTWLWQGHIPFGKVSTVEGLGGLGKSTILLDLMARCSKGTPGPLEDDSIKYEPFDCIVISAEDAAGDTIRPRLEAAGADLDRVHIVMGVNEKHRGEVTERGVALDRDIMRLENLVIKTKARFVVIDPIVAMMGGANFHSDQDVRRVLGSLSKMAARRSCAVTTIRHLTKDTTANILARGSGSMGFINAVRTAMIVVKHPESEDDRVVAVYKTNLTKAPQPVTYRFKSKPEDPVASIEWTGKSNKTIEQLVNGEPKQ